MAKHRIALIGGDGIGPEVVGEAVRVLRALSRAGRGPSFAFTSFPWGSDFYHKTGRMCPANYLDLLRPFDAILLGAVGRPDIPDHVTLNQLLLPIRRGFDLYVNSRPIVLYEGLESPLKGRKAGDIDMLFFRENTEGEYSPIGGRHYQGFPEEVAAQVALFTRRGCERIIAAAFEATDKNASTSADAPSNTSGHQKWNGTAESLNARPTMIIKPARASTINEPALSPAVIISGKSRASRAAIVGR